MKRDLWLIDGYNVLHSDREYWKFTLQDTGHARERLQEALLDFGGHRHLDIILVFDGKSSGAAEELDLNRHFRVVYTRRGQTADSYIEQQVYRLQDSFRYVYVVTSDGAEQSQISGNGGIRKPSRELMQELAADKHAQADDRRRSKKAPQGFSVGERIDAESRAILERIRHGRK